MLQQRLRTLPTAILVGLGIILIGLAAGIGLHEWRNRIVAKDQALPSDVHEVSLLADHAEPDTVLMKLGERLQFSAKDGRRHNIAEGKGNDYGAHHDHAADGAESGIFAADEAYRVTMAKPGTYYFHDDLDPRVFVTVVVYDPGLK